MNSEGFCGKHTLMKMCVVLCKVSFKVLSKILFKKMSKVLFKSL